MKSKTEQTSELLQNIGSILSNESSVELTQTSRGINWKIKIYNQDPYKALETSNDIYEKCKKRYGTVDK